MCSTLNTYQYLVVRSSCGISRRRSRPRLFPRKCAVVVTLEAAVSPVLCPPPLSFVALLSLSFPPVSLRPRAHFPAVPSPFLSFRFVYVRVVAASRVLEVTRAKAKRKREVRAVLLRRPCMIGMASFRWTSAGSSFFFVFLLSFSARWCV